MNCALYLLEVLYFFSIIRITYLELIPDYNTCDDCEQTDFEEDKTFLNRTQRAVVSLSMRSVWKNGIIPYKFNNVINGRKQLIIKQAMRIWEEFTCVQFVPRIIKIHKKYLTFTATPLCICCYFETSNRIFISLQDKCFELTHIYIVHELGHAIGFKHEHSRPDRDKYVEIITPPNKKLAAQFAKLSPDHIETFGLPYDFHSVMHYTYNLRPIDPKSEVLTNHNFKPSAEDILAANLLHQCCHCKKMFYQPSGTFEEPENDINGTFHGVERYEWRIRAAEGERIHLQITSLKIHQSYNCLLDYLEVRNGHDPNGVILARYCGEIESASVVASNFLLVVWVKVSLHNSPSSFNAEFKTICDGVVDVENNMSYNLESPNFPQIYPPNKNCVWKFSAPKDHQVVIKFNFFGLEESLTCSKDSVQIIDKNNFGFKIIGSFCGDQNDLDFKSTMNELQVIFSSDSKVEDAGFSATITAVPK